MARIDADHVYNILQSHIISDGLKRGMLSNKFYGWSVRPRSLRASDYGVEKKSVAKAPEPMTTPLPEVSYEGPGTKTEVRKMDTTGAKGLASTFRDRLAKAKERINRVGENMGNAMDNLERTAAQADNIVREVEKEAMELQSSIAEFGNGGPPLED